MLCRWGGLYFRSHVPVGFNVSASKLVLSAMLWDRSGVYSGVMVFKQYILQGQSCLCCVW